MAFRWAIPRKTFWTTALSWATQGFAVASAAVSLHTKDRKLIGQVFPSRCTALPAATTTIWPTRPRTPWPTPCASAFPRTEALKELRKAARDALLSLLWERTKQRPMVVVNLLEV